MGRGLLLLAGWNSPPSHPCPLLSRLPPLSFADVPIPRRGPGAGRPKGDLPMPDVLGWRKTFGAIGPSTNTVVQPDFDAMRPAGVTNHYSRIFTPN